MKGHTSIFIWVKKMDNSSRIATKLTGMQSNLLAAANRLSGVDGGPNARQRGFRYLAVVRPAALIRRLPATPHIIPFFFFFTFSFRLGLSPV